MARRPKKAEDGAPAWVVTYGDMMSLLLTFFIILVSMSELKQDRKFKRVMESLRLAFGYKGGIGSFPTDQPPETSLIIRLQEIVTPVDIRRIGSSPVKGIDGREPRVENVRKREDVFAGDLQFERFSDQLLPRRKALLGRLFEEVRGRTNLIEIVGHTTLEDLPPGSRFSTKDDLAFARARTVRDVLVELGLSAKRLRVISAADHEPLVSQAYTEDRLARNRRVEVVLMETLIQDYEGKKLS
ncbi:MAG: OmpA family protein, partial [Planctomycetota bacterium]|nr:OmpA family protein [Planctomycetota bacterium]